MQNIKNTLKYYLYNEFFNPSEIAVVSKKVEDGFEKFELKDNFDEKLAQKLADFIKKHEKTLKKPDYELVISVFGLPFYTQHSKDSYNSLFKALEAKATKHEKEIETNSGIKLSAFYNLSFKCSDDGFCFLENSLVLNASIWALANIDKLNLSDYESFLDTKEISAYINEILASDDTKSSLYNILNKINNSLKNDFYRNLSDELDELCSQDDIYLSLKVQKINLQNTQMLNSFYASDIFTLLKNIDNENFALLVKKLLTHRPSEKIDIRTNTKLAKELLENQVFSAFASKFPLRYSQLLCVNKYFKVKNNLQSINGAPGTGKTTLLKDIIANIITNRAMQIATFDSPDDIFDDKTKYENENGKFVWLYELNEKLRGYEIVVSSSNNGAVENISKEIPRKDDSIDDKFAHEYFKAPASRLLENEAWGLICATLGNSKNKNEFKRKVCNFDINKKDEVENEKTLSFDELPSLAQVLNDNKKADFKDEWQESKAEFLQALKEVEKLAKDCNYEPILDENQKELSSPFLIQDAKNTELFDAKRKLFAKALKLHEMSILANANKFLGVLNAIKCLFDKESLYKIENDKKIYLHSSESAQLDIFAGLFFMVPVISSTFASFSRLFGFTDTAFIGNLLIDEAGQATPPAALGALMRAKKCLVVGDPLQLEPVVTIPKNTCELLRMKAGALIEFDLNKTSLQSLSDQSENIGTFIEQNDDEKLWIGSPLRAHNRCLNPMFEISNKTTYNGLMIFAKHGKTPDDRAQVAGLTSSFIDAKSWSDGKTEQINQNEIALLNTLLDKILPEFNGEIQEKSKYLSIISPFRACANEAKRQIKEFYPQWNGFIQTGTIHTMQGKESKIVIFLLGGKSDGARRWAAAKPNLLNVAATRAKECFFMIGIAKNWREQEYFKDAFEILPEIVLDENLPKNCEIFDACEVARQLKESQDIDISRFDSSLYECEKENKLKFHGFNSKGEALDGLSIYIGEDSGLKRKEEFSFFDGRFESLIAPAILSSNSAKDSIEALKSGKINEVLLLSDFKQACRVAFSQGKLILCAWQSENLRSALNFVRELNSKVRVNIMLESGCSWLLDSFEEAGFLRLNAYILLLRSGLCIDELAGLEVSEILEQISRTRLEHSLESSSQIALALEAVKYDQNAFVMVD